MRRWVIVGVVAVLVLGAAGAGAWWLLRPKAKPEPVAAAYLEAWGRKDWAAMQAQVAAPPADFAKRHTDMVEALRVAGASFTPGAATVTDDRAELPFQAKLELRALGEWPYQGLLRLVRRDDRWLVDWSPATLHPDLADGQRFQRTRTWPERAPILAADGSELAGPGPVVTVNVVGERVKDPAEVADALEVHAQIPAKVARQAVADAERRPNQAVPVVTMPEADYQAIKEQIYPVPGLSFEAGVGREYNGPISTRILLGSVGPVTADDLTELGAPYQTGDETGHGNGLEAAFERQLAGTPSGEVRLAGGDGEAAKVLHRFPGEDGQALETTLDPRVQEAAEAALDSLAKPAALVAMQPSTGELLAVVNSPFHGYNRALLGRYPPGSTFKVVTAGGPAGGRPAPHRRGRLPQGGQGRRPHLRQLRGRGAGPDPVLQRLRPLLQHRLRAAGGQAAGRRRAGRGRRPVRLRARPVPGIPAVTSQVPPPSDRADLAAESFGQGRVTASPLQMALVAATVAEGRWRQPTLVSRGGRQPRRSPRPARRQGGRDPADPDAPGGHRGHGRPGRPPRQGRRQDRHSRVRHRRPPPHPRLVHRLPRRPGLRGGGRGRRRRRPGRRPGRREVPPRPLAGRLFRNGPGTLPA